MAAEAVDKTLDETASTAGVEGTQVGADVGAVLTMTGASEAIAEAGATNSSAAVAGDVLAEVSSGNLTASGHQISTTETSSIRPASPSTRRDSPGRGEGRRGHA